MNDKQLADQIIARAQGEVASRRAAGRERRWGGRWPWLLSTLVLAVLVAFLAAPQPLPRKLLLAMGGVCGLRPAHSYFAGGIQLTIESRDGSSRDDRHDPDLCRSGKAGREQGHRGDEPITGSLSLAKTTQQKALQEQCAVAASYQSTPSASAHAAQARSVVAPYGVK